MEKIYISFTKELRNILFGALFMSLDHLLDSKNVNTPVTAEVAKRIKIRTKELEQLRIGKQDTQLTKKINEKLHIRTKYLASLRMKIKAKQITYLPQKRKAADRLIFWLDRYKKDLFKPSTTTQSNLVNAMIDDRKRILEIQECITLLDLNGLLDEIKRLTDEIFEDTLQRSKEDTYSKTLVENLRNAAYSDLEILINAIKIDYLLTNDEEKKKELSALNGMISSLLKGMRTKQRSRRTRSKNKREMAAVVEELINTIYPPAPAQSNLPMVNYNELKLFDKRKATTTNPSQQTLHENTTLLKSSEKDRKTNTKPNSKKELNNSNATVRDKNKEDNNKLPPIGKN